MVREFQEETGLTTTCLDWHKFCIMKSKDFTVHCYKANLNIFPAKSMTEEVVEIVPFHWLEKETRLISNIKWLIEMSKDADALKRPLVVEYGSLV
jgi:8-oxo-dGTP pyrophosphatase MutT (NUDIX family)